MTSPTTRHIGVVFYRQIRGKNHFNKLVHRYQSVSELLSRTLDQAHFADGTFISLHSPESIMGLQFDKVFIDREIPPDFVKCVITRLKQPELEDTICYY